MSGTGRSTVANLYFTTTLYMSTVNPMNMDKEKKGQNFKQIIQECRASQRYRQDEIPGSLNLEVILSTTALK